MIEAGFSDLFSYIFSMDMIGGGYNEKTTGSQAAIPAVADVLRNRHEEHDLNRFFHGSDCHFPDTVRAGNLQGYLPASRSFKCDT